MKQSPMSDDVHDRVGLDTNPLFQSALKHHQSGNLLAAVEGYNQALRQKPDARDALNNLGVALRSLGRREEALVVYRRLHAFHPPRAPSLINLGNLLRELGHFDECCATFIEALELEPSAKGALYGLGLVWRDLNKLEKSLAYFDQALEYEPNDPDLNWDRAQTLLRMGDYQRGFEAYEWRWKLARTTVRHFDAPEWDGSSLGGRTLLLFGEQGFGDAIQFVRFIPSLAAKYRTKVLLEVRPELARLLDGQIDGVGALVSRGEKLPSHDCRLSLLSVPRILRTTTETVPRDPYIDPKPGFASIGRYGRALASVGLVWAGSPSQANDRNRTYQLSDTLPLLENSSLQFFSLQKGDAVNELAESGMRHVVTSVGPMLRDFADTSAVIDKLDLVITADTSVAHLAGAMGKPVWIALSVFHDWRYDATGSIKAWYPSAKVFRQEKPGDWSNVFKRMSVELRSPEAGVVRGSSQTLSE